MNIKEAISLLITKKRSLTEAEMEACLNEIMDAKASDAQVAGFLSALAMKGETFEEILGAARVMRQKAIKIASPEGTIDTCGTGGDNSGTFNISTASAIVVSACGVPVAKHGNRSVSSRSGSADVLEALGVKVDLPPEKVERCLFETGFGFLFAPMFHPAMKNVAHIRRDLGIRTIFNILGPITNPAGTKRQLIGLFNPNLTEVIAKVLHSLGSERAFVVYGLEGLDEISLFSKTQVSELKNGEVTTYCIEPSSAGLRSQPIETVLGGDRQTNAEIILALLEGAKGAPRDIVVFNASAALLVAGKVSDLREGVGLAQEAIDSKRALAKLKEIVAFTNSV